MTLITYRLWRVLDERVSCQWLAGTQSGGAMNPQCTRHAPWTHRVRDMRPNPLCNRHVSWTHCGLSMRKPMFEKAPMLQKKSKHKTTFQSCLSSSGVKHQFGCLLMNVIWYWKEPLGNNSSVCFRKMFIHLLCDKDVPIWKRVISAHTMLPSHDPPHWHCFQVHPYCAGDNLTFTINQLLQDLLICITFHHTHKQIITDKVFLIVYMQVW